MERLLGRDEVLAQTSLGRRTLYEKVKAGEFPKPVQVSTQRRAWRESEVQAWIRERITERDSKRARKQVNQAAGRK